MAITSRHINGWRCEVDILPRLEEALGEKLTHTKGRYDHWDFEGPSWLVELKSRSPFNKFGQPFDSNSYDTWLVPGAKIISAKEQKKPFIIFTYFERDNTLWYIIYDEVKFGSFYTEYPTWHATRQLHYYIPKKSWSLVE